MMERERDVTLFAYTALQVEALRPGTIPQELIESLSKKVDTAQLSPDCICPLEDKSIEQVEGVEGLLKQDTDMGKLLAIQRVKKLALKKDITPDDVIETKRLIEDDIKTFNRLLMEGCSQ